MHGPVFLAFVLRRGGSLGNHALASSGLFDACAQHEPSTDCLRCLRGTHGERMGPAGRLKATAHRPMLGLGCRSGTCLPSQGSAHSRAPVLARIGKARAHVTCIATSLRHNVRECT